MSLARAVAREEIDVARAEAAKRRAEERLAFDYRLQAGPTTSRNALRLLSLIGLSPT